MPLKSITFTFFTRKLLASSQDNLQQAVYFHICVTEKPSRVCQYLDILHRDLHIPITMIRVLPIKHKFYNSSLFQLVSGATRLMDTKDRMDMQWHVIFYTIQFDTH